jgi:serine/threonine protein phosphatase PrpC
MEDASMIISPFTHRNYSLFGIFDGHGGIYIPI